MNKNKLVMKKIFLICVISIQAYCQLWAQDTISGCGPKNNYFVRNDWWCQHDTLVYWQWCGLLNSDIAYPFYTDDTLVIYGLAASYTFEWEILDSLNQNIMNPPIHSETDRNLVEESLRIYKRDSINGLRQIGEDLTINLGTTPVSYYRRLTQVLLLRAEFTSLPPFPVYELYYDKPLVVIDTFWVGRTQNWAYNATLTELSPERLGFYPTYCAQQSHIAPSGRDTTLYWKFNLLPAPDQFLFPILTPNPDTTGVIDTIAGGDDTISGGSDTLLVGQTCMINRTVLVSPNPATEQVKVVSGVGLLQVEVYDVSGRRMLSEKASGMTFRFDVKGWRKGCYSVVVQTPAGKVTKKILVE